MRRASIRMLGNFETGYEGKFDFPPTSTPPERTYLLAAVPRAGSTYLSHALWATGCLGAPLEYLNFEAAGPYGFAANSSALQLELWRSVLRRRCSPNGVFGLKAFSPQLQKLHRHNGALLAEVLAATLPRERDRRVIYLRRRSRVEHVVSYARALLTGVWRKEQETELPPAIEYSQEAVDAAERGIAFQEGVWSEMFDDLEVVPLELWHEDVLADPEATARRVGEYLGVDLDPAARIPVPPILKQAERDSRAWLQRYGNSLSIDLDQSSNS